MLDKVKIQQLRSQINCTLAEAVALLKVTDDFQQAKILHLEQKLAHICKQTGCDKSLAEQQYEHFHGNMEKAIVSIINTLQYEKITKVFELMTTDTDYVGYEIYGADEYNQEIDIEDNRTLLSIQIFELIRPAFESVFPVYNSRINETEMIFDTFCSNTFKPKQCQIIASRIRQLSSPNNEIQHFFSEFSDWLEQRANYAHHVVVESNR